MADSLMQLLRLVDEDLGVEPRPRPRPNRSGASCHNSPSHSASNSGTQNLHGLINNTGYVNGNGNGSIVFGGFDSSTKNYY